MFFFELSTFSNKHTNKQKELQGAADTHLWFTGCISGQIECFLCHDHFWVASLRLIVPPNIASIISQNQTPSVTQRLSDIRSCSAFALLSIWLQIPPKTLYHYPPCLCTMHLRAGTTYGKHQLLIDDIYWYFHHPLKTLILHIFLPRATSNMFKVVQLIYSFTYCMFSRCPSLQWAYLPSIHFYTHLLLSGSGVLQILI